MVQEAANESGIFTQRAAHHHTTPQSVEDELEESETEGLIGTPEIIRPSPETFVQLPLPSTQPSIIPCLSPSQGQAPLQPPTPQPTPQISPPVAAAVTNVDGMVQHLLCALVTLGQSMAQNLPPQVPTPVLLMHLMFPTWRTCRCSYFNASSCSTPTPRTLHQSQLRYSLQ